MAHFSNSNINVKFGIITVIMEKIYETQEWGKIVVKTPSFSSGVEGLKKYKRNLKAIIASHSAVGASIDIDGAVADIEKAKKFCAYLEKIRAYTGEPLPEAEFVATLERKYNEILAAE